MFNKFRKQKNIAPTGAPEFLVVGLGNPGNKYTNTRHNAGFLCLDILSEKLNLRINRLKFKSLICDTNINGHRCIVMKPQTFMNNSGEAVRECATFYKIPIENIIVISDDTSLDVGKMRIRRKGSDGGQKGLRSIIEHMNSDNFPRVKIGVGKKPHPDYDMADWVLSEFKKDEQKALLPIFENACKAIELLLDNQIDKAMNLYNS